MPAGGGARAAREIRARSPRTRVVALSAYEDRRTLIEMLRAGATSYLVKGVHAEDLLETVRRAAQGQSSLSFELTTELVSELVELLERSERLTAELRDLNRDKSELVQVLSQELFTPIAAIRGAAAALSAWKGQLPPEEIEELAATISRAGTRLGRMVGDASAAARLGREGVEIATRPVVLRELFDRMVSDFGDADERLKVPSDEDAVLTDRI